MRLIEEKNVAEICKHDYIVVSGEKPADLYVKEISVDGYLYSVFTDNDDKLLIIKSLINDVYVSNAFVKMAGLDPVDSHTLDKIKNALYNKYRCDNIWLSNRGKVFADKQQIKIGKLLRVINPDIATWEIDHAVDALKAMSINYIKRVTFEANVTEIYNSSAMKISSCMVNKGYNFKLLEDLGIKVAILRDEKDNIIARTLVHDGKYYDRVYATNEELRKQFRKHLKSVGMSKVPNGYETKKVKVDKDTFYPYMDNVKYLTRHEDGMISLRKGQVVVNILNRTDGELEYQ